MEPDDFTAKKTDALQALEGEDLSTLSMDELEDRAARLGAEIHRAEVMATRKRASKDAADAIFKA